MLNSQVLGVIVLMSICAVSKERFLRLQKISAIADIAPTSYAHGHAGELTSANTA